MSTETVTFLRRGRSIRCQGTILSRPSPGVAKVKPTRKDWGAFLVTEAEIAAGAVKPPVKQREKKEVTEPVKRERKTKAPPIPRWKQLVEEARHFQKTHEGDAIMFPITHLISNLADELESNHTPFLK